MYKSLAMSTLSFHHGVVSAPYIVLILVFHTKVSFSRTLFGHSTANRGVTGGDTAIEDQFCFRRNWYICVLFTDSINIWRFSRRRLICKMLSGSKGGGGHDIAKRGFLYCYNCYLLVLRLATATTTTTTTATTTTTTTPTTFIWVPYLNPTILSINQSIDLRIYPCI